LFLKNGRWNKMEKRCISTLGENKSSKIKNDNSSYPQEVRRRRGRGTIKNFTLGEVRFVEDRLTPHAVDSLVTFIMRYAKQDKKKK